MKLDPILFEVWAILFFPSKLFVFKKKFFSGILESTLSTVLKSIHEVIGRIKVATSLDLFALLIEIGSNFSSQLVIGNVIDIIEMCHFQIEEYLLQKGFGNCHTTTAVNNFQSMLNYISNSSISSEDKLLSAVYLTASQVCHYFAKQRITAPVAEIDSTQPPKVSQDFIFLLLYLCKKMESKVYFYRHLKWNAGEENPAENQLDGKYFLMMKIFNCLYLKCIHYTLLTIPDAWRFMCSRFMEVIWSVFFKAFF